MRNICFLSHVRSGFVATLLLMCFHLLGCSEKAPFLDTSIVTNPLGQPGICEHCGKSIAKVAEEHLITVRGNQYTVCDEKCVAGLKEWLAKQ